MDLCWYIIVGWFFEFVGLSVDVLDVDKVVCTFGWCWVVE